VFERADGGTLLIDEIAELAIDLQSKLLRALDRGEVRKVGDSSYLRFDVRVIAMTSAPLERRVHEGTFREDLLHRLSVFDLRVPALRERGRDALAIAREVAEESGAREPGALERIEREVGAKLGYQWPGNVRELKSFVRRTLALGTGETGAPPLGADLPRVRLDLPFHDAKKRWNESFERQYLAAVLDECAGNVSEAARRSGLHRAHLHEMLEKLGIR
jgi:two-component system nitrogen regulation response regulator GlnG